ncbi:hypothetical protein [Dactylosporangium matsuzakiense]|uniref:hypothetical protein n=1 Tax=Dactylosporangium matsuzakiense TaxID=53360 RepID=UPI0021C3FE0E|nr:hypothetical protein [Dactylosporangium matsuzakiense]UWZ45603.1 hypothetical protein Dmats_03530 [Dactylosporangium matsuzakiense]
MASDGAARQVPVETSAGLPGKSLSKPALGEGSSKTGAGQNPRSHRQSEILLGQASKGSPRNGLGRAVARRLSKTHLSRQPQIFDLHDYLL